MPTHERPPASEGITMWRAAELVDEADLKLDQLPQVHHLDSDPPSWLPTALPLSTSTQTRSGNRFSERISL